MKMLDKITPKHLSNIRIRWTTSCLLSNVSIITISSHEYVFESKFYITDEKNEKMKALVRSKIDEYLARAENLKEHVKKVDDKKVKSALGANGSTGSGATKR